MNLQARKGLAFQNKKDVNTQTDPWVSGWPPGSQIMIPQ